MKLNDLGSSMMTKERNTPNELGFSLEIFQVAISNIFFFNMLYLAWQYLLFQ